MPRDVPCRSSQPTSQRSCTEARPGHRFGLSYPGSAAVAATRSGPRRNAGLHGPPPVRHRVRFQKSRVSPVEERILVMSDLTKNPKARLVVIVAVVLLAAIAVVLLMSTGGGGGSGGGGY